MRRDRGRWGAALVVDLLQWAGFLIAVVHEGADIGLGLEAGVVDGRTALAGVEAAGKQGVGAEFGRASVELAGVAEDQSGAAVHGLDDAADLDVHVAILL